MRYGAYGIDAGLSSFFEIRTGAMAGFGVMIEPCWMGFSAGKRMSGDTATGRSDGSRYDSDSGFAAGRGREGMASTLVSGAFFGGKTGEAVSTGGATGDASAEAASGGAGSGGAVVATC